MKALILLFIVCSFWAVRSQSQLLGVSAWVDMTTEQIKVQEAFRFNVPDSVQSLEFKAIQFKGITVSIVSATTDGKTLTIEELKSKGLRHFKVKSSDNKSLQNVLLTYTVTKETESFYLPLFFTNVPGASSDDNFFTMEMQLPKNKEYQIHFPRVPIDEGIEGAVKKIRFQLPALPSLIRIELPIKQAKGLSFVTLVDASVALLFLGIGYLIWRNRKQLIYG